MQDIDDKNKYRLASFRLEEEKFYNQTKQREAKLQLLLLTQKKTLIELRHKNLDADEEDLLELQRRQKNPRKQHEEIDNCLSSVQIAGDNPDLARARGENKITKKRS